MVRNAIQYPASVLGDAITNMGDAGKLSGVGMIATGICVGAGFVFAPHLLALNGAIALFGSLGRAAGEDAKIGESYKDEFGRSVTVIGEQTGAAYLAELEALE